MTQCVVYLIIEYSFNYASWNKKELTRGLILLDTFISMHISLCCTSPIISIIQEMKITFREQKNMWYYVQVCLVLHGKNSIYRCCTKPKWITERFPFEGNMDDVCMEGMLWDNETWDLQNLLCTLTWREIFLKVETT